MNPSRAEAQRLHRVRQRQGGATLGAALKSAQTQKAGGDRILTDTLTSILYAAYLGDPQGPALAAGNVALRHELGTSGVMAQRMPWRLPTEGHSDKGWRVSGSLLGLDVGLARLSLRRLDSMVMPPEPRPVVRAPDRSGDSLAAESAPPLRRGARRDRGGPGARPRAAGGARGQRG